MKKQTKITLIVVVIAGIIISITIFNLCSNETFLTASITQILTLAVTLGIAFWATQYKTDIRKTKEHAEDVIRKLQSIVSDKQFYSIPAEGNKEEIQKLVNSTNRKINNCITILCEYSKTLGFNEEINYIHNEFEKYKERTGEHINDLDYLSKSEDEFKRISNNIDFKCDYIILSLYK